MFNWENIKNKAGLLYDDASKKIKQYTPESFSKEKKFVNSLVISLSLMTMADKKAEKEEIEASINILKDIDEIKELDMIQEALELYELHINSLSVALASDIKWTMTIAKLLSECSKVKDYPQYVVMIQNLLNYIANSDGNFDDSEKEMKQKILDSLK